MRYEISTDERFPTMWWKLCNGEPDNRNAVDIPEHLVTDLHRAHRNLQVAERMVVDHLVATGQWDKSDIPECWLV